VFGALLLGYAMAYAIETPVLKLRDRFYPSRVRSRNQPGKIVPSSPAT
jgi:hypothetical protein